MTTAVAENATTSGHIHCVHFVLLRCLTLDEHSFDTCPCLATDLPAGNAAKVADEAEGLASDETAKEICDALAMVSGDVAVGYDDMANGAFQVMVDHGVFATAMHFGAVSDD